MAAHAAIVLGVVLSIEAAVTMVWREPVSSILAARAQAGLGEELGRLEARARGRLARVERRPGRRELARRLARRQMGRSAEGEAIGRLGLPTLGEEFAMVEGTEAEPLSKGPGHYQDTPLPGIRGTFAVAGHRTTYLAPFRDIDELRRGEPIVAAMPYGTFVYRVEETRIVEPGAVWVKDSVGRDRIVLTACHPPFSAAQRIVVFGALDRVRLLDRAGTGRIAGGRDPRSIGERAGA